MLRWLEISCRLYQNSEGAITGIHLGKGKIYTIIVNETMRNNSNKDTRESFKIKVEQAKRNILIGYNLIDLENKLWFKYKGDIIGKSL